jgi:phosphate transport system substrate-binding protein
MALKNARTPPALVGATAALLLAGPALSQEGRETISIVGSSTVYPFTAAVAERFSSGGKFAAPKIESGGSGGGIKLFCKGTGAQHPDIVNTSRRIKTAEREDCAQNGVEDIVEIKIGYDGIVLVSNRKNGALKLSRRDVYLALAKKVPDRADPSKLIANPYKAWNQINPALPSRKIEILGPSQGTGTRDAFAELVLEAGCDTVPWIKALKDVERSRYQNVCQSLREDGVYVESGDDYDSIARRIESNPHAIGIVGYSFLKGRTDKLIGGLLDGFGPTLETIATGRYPASRPLYIYVKKAHIGLIPGLKEFVAEFVSAAAQGHGSYLVDKGLVPLHEDEVGEIRASALALKSS